MKSNIPYKYIQVIDSDYVPAVGAFKAEYVGGPLKGMVVWYYNNKIHRIGGPAMIHATGEKSWWINDHVYASEREYWIDLQKQGWDISQNSEAITSLI